MDKELAKVVLSDSGHAGDMTRPNLTTATNSPTHSYPHPPPPTLSLCCLREHERKPPPTRAAAMDPLRKRAPANEQRRKETEVGPLTDSRLHEKQRPVN